ncbi:MAG TPA: cytochrome c3 family protein [Candidatus Eisenbacteria bacterium]
MLLLLAAPVRGAWPGGTTVLETFHNLTHPAAIAPMSGMIGNYAQACVYCHAPHGSAGERPLWNRRLPSGPYRMYGPLNMLGDPQPTGVSRNCLSCHDGTIGLDDVLVAPAGFTSAGPFRETIQRCTSCHNGGNPAGGFNFEKLWFRPDDLRNQHPISVLYDASRDPNFLPAGSVVASGLVLEDGKVQCATCHEPHTARYRPFLRIPNTNGSLCLLCHRTPPSRTTAHFW